MNITQAKGYVLDTVRAYLQVDAHGLPLLDAQAQRPLFLIGPPGIGKTAIMGQVASELGIGLVSYSMTHHTRQSALGLPIVQHCDYKGFEYDASEYTMSEIIAALYDYMRRTGLEQGILFLDEVNCVSETLYPSMLQFLQFKTFGKHAVPQGWIIVCAGNPAEYNRSVHEFDVVTLDRIRRIEVEPDVDSWRAYAADAGVHPAVTTFLEAQRDCFYRIESTPSGKRFVTARSWDDLSRMIALNESLEIPVDEGLIGQFVQDDDIAERFWLYYELFSKYRSDYQVPSILEGRAGADIVERARAARLDERMALLGLLVDSLAPRADDVLVQQSVLTAVRDELREAKPSVVAGERAEEALSGSIAGHAQELDRLRAAGVRDGHVEQEVRVLEVLRACAAAGALAGNCSGEEAFAAIHQEFRGSVGAFEAEVAAVRDALGNAFSFIGDAFGGGREELLFTSELTARRAIVLFVSQYGCDAFERASAGVVAEDAKRDLAGRIDEALGNGSGNVEGHAGQASPAAGHANPPEVGAASPSPATARVATGRPGESELLAYYENARWEFGYASLCHMALPEGLAGKIALDIGCRRGKGVFKLSERVGAQGRAIGVDWVRDHIAEATERMGRAFVETGLPRNNMEFHLAYPEDLMAAGIGDATVDFAFVNSILHLTCEPAVVLTELARVLKPGGLLVCEVALADAPRDAAVADAARALGNSIQAAPARDAFMDLLEALGFEAEVVEGPHPVEPNQGFKRGHEVPVAPSGETVSFAAYVIHAHRL